MLTADDYGPVLVRAEWLQWPSAQNRLGLYELTDGNNGSSEKKQGRYIDAVKWFSKAADRGYAEAQDNLGHCYENGKGVMKDEAEAIKWYRKAVEHTDDYYDTTINGKAKHALTKIMEKINRENENK